MNTIELYISKKYWFFIFFIAILFGFILGFIIKQSSFGGIIGSVTGLFIAVFAFIFISFMNSKFLPKIDKKYWVLVAFLFSFFSGFFGSEISFSIFMVEHDHYLAISTGMLTYLFGLILYLFSVSKNREAQLKQSLMESRLKSLEGQLNPHFLFNSINVISELIYQDQSLAEETLINLAKFLRKSMKEEKLIPIKEELDVVKNYLWIQNIRFNSKIQTTETVDFSLNDFLIPKFSLQLLVENAIKHHQNIAQNGIKIFIKIRKNHKKQILITVSNTIDREIKSLKYGIGLNNLQDRVKILHNGTINWTYEKTEKLINFNLCLNEHSNLNN
jgi:sensor histidine kinase YesM